MMSAAWLKVVNRPFASNVAMASDADSNRLRYRASERASVSCARFCSVMSRSVATVPSSSPSTTRGVAETATTRSSPVPETILVSKRCSSPASARRSRSATSWRSLEATRSSVAVPGRSSSGRPNNSAAARLALRTRRSRLVTTTASAREATMSAATRNGSSVARFGPAFGGPGSGGRPRVVEVRRPLLMCSRRVCGHHRVLHEDEAHLGRLGHAGGALAASHAVLDDLQRLDRMLVVVLRVLLEPPAAARADPFVLRQPLERLRRDLLRHALHGVVGRRHRRAERRAPAHLGQVAVERLHLGDHRLGALEALSRDLEAVSHGAPHRVVPLLYADVVPEEALPLRGRAAE